MIRFAGILICCILLTSCNITSVIPIDYLQSASVSVPSTIKSVLVVNNTPYNEEDSIGKRKIYKSQLYKKFGRLSCDTKVTTENLAQNLAEQNYFDEIIICDSLLRKNDYFSRESKLSQREVEELTNEFLVDMVVALESANLYIKKRSFFTPEFALPQTSIDAIVTSMVRIYFPNRSEPLVTLNNNDSIFWVLPYSTKEVGEEILQEASVFAATLPIKYIVPIWKTVDRYFYRAGSIEMRDAAIYIYENNWQQAYQLWEKAYQKKSRKLQMRSALNIALYHEMMDNLDEAHKWVQTALSLTKKKQEEKKNDNQKEESQPEPKTNNISEDYSLIMLYNIELNQRILDRKKLNLQMERFQE